MDLILDIQLDWSFMDITIWALNASIALPLNEGDNEQTEKFQFGMGQVFNNFMGVYYVKKIFYFFFIFFTYCYAELKVGFVKVDEILKDAPQAAESNKKLEAEFKS